MRQCCDFCLFLIAFLLFAFWVRYGTISG